ncbi:MAG: hypothetical protein KIS81_07575 [Maricaulaceae bacterium]|nr:hypothetical protein [Maricaulaceae bacterium]
MTLVETLAALAAVIGAGLGVFGLLAPSRAAALVKLQALPGLGGFAEFRATYGGFFLGLHAAFLIALFLGAGVIGAAGVLCLGWGGVAAGRALSMLADKGEGTRTQFNAISLVFEALIALAFAGPVYAFVTG